MKTHFVPTVTERVLKLSAVATVMLGGIGLFLPAVSLLALVSMIVCASSALLMVQDCQRIVSEICFIRESSDGLFEADVKAQAEHDALVKARTAEIDRLMSVKPLDRRLAAGWKRETDQGLN